MRATSISQKNIPPMDRTEEENRNLVSISFQVPFESYSI